MMFMFLLVLDSVGISVKSSGCKAQADTDYLGELDISVFYFLPVLSGVDCTCLAIVEESLCSLTDSLNYLLSVGCCSRHHSQKRCYDGEQNRQGSHILIIQGGRQTENKLKKNELHFLDFSRVFEDTVGITVGESSLQQVFMALPPIATSVLCLCFGNVLFTCILIHWSCIWEAMEMAFLHFGVNSFLVVPSLNFLMCILFPIK